VIALIIFNYGNKRIKIMSTYKLFFTLHDKKFICTANNCSNFMEARQKVVDAIQWDNITEMPEYDSPVDAGKKGFENIKNLFAKSGIKI